MNGFFFLKLFENIRTVARDANWGSLLVQCQWDVPLELSSLALLGTTLIVRVASKLCLRSIALISTCTICSSRHRILFSTGIPR